MPDGQVEPVGLYGPDLAEVTAEMSEVFVLAGWGLSEPGLRRPVVAESSPRLGGERAAILLTTLASGVARLGGGRVAILLTALASGVVGFGAGALVAHAPRTPVVADAKLRAEPQLQPQDTTLTPPPLQSLDAPPIALAQAAPFRALEGPPANTPATAKASPNRAKAAAKARARFRMKLQRLDEPRPATAGPPIRLGGEPRPVAQPASCERDARSDDCRRAVKQADLHLQDVYQSAVRRGVPQEALVGYRSRWAAVRDRDSGDPARLIEGYGALAYDLGRENAR
jgi:hypothetical protein